MQLTIDRKANCGYLALTDLLWEADVVTYEVPHLSIQIDFDTVTKKITGIEFLDLNLLPDNIRGIFEILPSSVSHWHPSVFSETGFVIKAAREVDSSPQAEGLV